MLPGVLESASYERWGKDVLIFRIVCHISHVTYSDNTPLCNFDNLSMGDVENCAAER